MSTLAKMLADRAARRVETRRVGIDGESKALDGKWAGTLSARKGAMNESLACAHLLSLGYDVFRNVSADGPADIIAVNWNNGERTAIDVKSDGFSIGNYEGQETLERAKELDIAVMIVRNNGLVEWYNNSSGGSK